MGFTKEGRRCFHGWTMRGMCVPLGLGLYPGAVFLTTLMAEGAMLGYGKNYPISCIRQARDMPF